MPMRRAEDAMSMGKAMQAHVYRIGVTKESLQYGMHVTQKAAVLMVLSKPHADVVSASISLLDSCVNTYHALGAIHRQQHAVLNHGRPNDRPCTVPGAALVPVMTSGSRLGSGGIPSIFLRTASSKGSSLGGGGAPITGGGMILDHANMSAWRCAATICWCAPPRPARISARESRNTSCAPVVLAGRVPLIGGGWGA